LRGFGGERDERLLVGPQTMDDAGVVRLGQGEGLPAESELLLVQSVDFFPPVVDDPWFYGAIAAANALSDVYAMGGRPVSALNLAAFPKDFPEEWMAAIFRGGHDTLRAAGAVLAGGHTVETQEVQFGFAVTGVVARDQVRTNAGARAGDRLFLTKPLGAGALTTGAKLGKITWEEIRPAAESMARLNAAAADAMHAAGAHAATDVTGFGLVGHAKNVAEASGVALRFETARLPLYPGALELARRGVLSGGSKRGQRAFRRLVRVGAGVEPALVDLLFDAETSGGLLIAVGPDAAERLAAALAERGLPADPVGEVVARGEHAIELR
jgi:selenide, water dikinase